MVFIEQLNNFLICIETTICIHFLRPTDADLSEILHVYLLLVYNGSRCEQRNMTDINALIH
jgi:hypothetical protein